MDNRNLQTKKIFLYARKSTDEPERQVLSIEAQMFELREYAKKEGLNIVREFVESKTAKEPGREIFNDMIASIEKNEAEGILAWHPDRLARNSIDGGRIIYLVDTGKITTLKFPTFWFDPTPQGKFMLSIAQIRKIINSLGLVGKKGKMLSVSNYQYMLKNKIYYGMIEYNGELYDGKHEPIITKKLFDSVAEVMSRKSKPHSKGLKPYIYRGFFRCGECGCFITTEQQKGHHYLRCTKRKNPCTQKYVREELITSQIQEEIKKVSLPLDWTKWMIAENAKDRQSEVQSSTLFADSIKADISLLETKIEKLMSAYLESALSLEEYREAKNKLVNQNQLLKEKLSAFLQKANNRFELTEKFLKYNIELANDRTNEENTHLLKKVGSNFQIKDRTVLFEPRGAWRILAESGFCGGNAKVPPLRGGSSGVPETDFGFLRRGRDSNPRYGLTRIMD